MKNFILASTSTVYGSEYLEYLKDEIIELFADINKIIFIPYARPSAMTHDAYTNVAANFFKEIDIEVKGLHTFSNAQTALRDAKGIFTGGGNTFLLVKQLYDLNLMEILKDKVLQGTPYLGTSAGSNIAGIDMKTTNDMPIVYPPSFETLGIIPCNINPHYLDPDTNSKHKGETRETRILEYLSQNSNTVLGLREGNWIRGKEDAITILGPNTTRIFLNNKEPYEVNSKISLKEIIV